MKAKVFLWLAAALFSCSFQILGQVPEKRIPVGYGFCRQGTGYPVGKSRGAVGKIRTDIDGYSCPDVGGDFTMFGHRKSVYSFYFRSE